MGSKGHPPALHQQRGIAAGEPLHQVAVLGICRLLSRGQNHNAGLRAQEAVTARKDDARAADQAAITNVVGMMLFSGGG